MDFDRLSADSDGLGRGRGGKRLTGDSIADDSQRDEQWELEVAWLTHVTGEIQRQLQALGMDTSNRRENLRETRRFMFDSLHTSISSADESVEVGQLLQEHRQQAALHEWSQGIGNRLQSILSRPYFGRVDFLDSSLGPLRTNTPTPSERLYIGFHGLQGRGYEELVYDWRAPIANLYYDFEPGPAHYQVGDTVCQGELKGKRQYLIHDGVLKSFFDSEVTIGDAWLCELLSQSAGGPMRSIVASIQREQNRAIRVDNARNLVVQGVAGSGKTSVALQRAAYLLYRYRGHMTSLQIVILSPNALFADYISQVLPELGEDNVWQTTLRMYLDLWLGSDVVVEGAIDWWERLTVGIDPAEVTGSRLLLEWKGSLRYRDAMLQFGEHLRQGGIPFVAITYKGGDILSEPEQRAVYSGGPAWRSIADRLAAVVAHVQEVLATIEVKRARQVYLHWRKHGGYLAEDEELRRRAAAKARREVSEITALFRAQAAFHADLLYLHWHRQRDLFLAHTASSDFPEAMRDQLRLQSLKRLELGEVPREDVAAIALLLQLLDPEHVRSDIRHVVVDEAQDYTPFELSAAKSLFPRARFTILGDRAQALGDDAPSVSDLVAPVFGVDGMQVIELRRSYRSTEPIRNLAQAFGGQPQAPDDLRRTGSLPKRVIGARIAVDAALIAEISAKVAAGTVSIAVLTRTRRESREIFSRVPAVIGARLIVTGEERFRNGVAVMPVYLSKGLEFDVVLLTAIEDYRLPRDRSLLYVACTRALHELFLYERRDGTGDGAGIWEEISDGLYDSLILA